MSEDTSKKKDVGSNSVETMPTAGQDPSPQGVFSVKQSKKPLPWRIIIAVIIVLAVLGGGLGWWLSQRSSTPKDDASDTSSLTIATVCDNATIQSAGRPIADNNIEALQVISDSILQKKNYRGDVNCNYILMRYYLMTGDVIRAKKTMNDVSFTHGHSGGYSTAFDPPAISPADLRTTLEVMIDKKEEQQKQDDELNGLDQ